MRESLHVLEPGSQVQNAIYLAGGTEWPVSPDDWEARARETLEQGPFDYVAGGAGSESTIRANREAFERRRLRPRMLVGTAERDLSVEVLGLRSPAPFLLAPVGVLSIVHQEAELGVARASKATGVPMILSSAASTPLEDVAAELGDAQRWFQLYWWSDRELAGSLVDRAAAAGYGAIVVTLDTLTLGWRERDLGNGYLPFLRGRRARAVLQRPALPRAAGRAAGGRHPDRVADGAGGVPEPRRSPGPTWTGCATGPTLPILVKGVLRGDDARLALEHGVDGIVVSNHGGRQVDGSIASLDALVEVREEVGPDATVLMDGGIRRGADVLKALALGADAVLLGRLYAYGLAVGGAAGVEAVIRQLAAELDLTMALAGVRSVRDSTALQSQTCAERPAPAAVSARCAVSPDCSSCGRRLHSSSATTGASAPAATVKVAFLQGEQVVYVTRNGSTLRQAVTALLAGPTAAEQRREIASAVPPGTPLRAVSVTGGVATIDLGEKFAAGTNTASLSARVTQLVLTATSVSGVKSVRLQVKGATPLGLFPGFDCATSRPISAKFARAPDLPPPGQPAPEPTTDPTAAVRELAAAPGRPVVPDRPTPWMGKAGEQTRFKP